MTLKSLFEEEKNKQKRPDKYWGGDVNKEESKVIPKRFDTQGKATTKGL